jgi:hypothetical protein
MAVHRPQVFELVPRHLLTFALDDWVSRGESLEDAWQRWHEARFAYLLEHPWQTLDGLDVIDLIFEVP